MALPYLPALILTAAEMAVPFSTLRFHQEHQDTPAPEETPGAPAAGQPVTRSPARSGQTGSATREWPPAPPHPPSPLRFPSPSRRRRQKSPAVCVGSAFWLGKTLAACVGSAGLSRRGKGCRRCDAAGWLVRLLPPFAPPLRQPWPSHRPRRRHKQRLQRHNRPHKRR